MKVTHKLIEQTVELLRLNFDVYIEKNKGLVSHEMPEDYTPTNFNYFVVTSPGSKMFFKKLYTSYIILSSLSEEVKKRIENENSYSPVSKLNYFYNALVDCEELEEWEKHEIHYYTKYLKEVLYPYNESLLSMQ